MTSEDKQTRTKCKFLVHKRTMSDCWFPGEGNMYFGYSQQHDVGSIQNSGPPSMPYGEMGQCPPGMSFRSTGMAFGSMPRFVPNMPRPPMHMPVTQEVAPRQEPEGEAVEAIRSKKGSNFSVQEDKILVSAWLFVSTDAAVGSGMRRDLYWKSITDRYNSMCGEFEKRTQKSLNNRWSNIQKECNKYNSSEKQVQMANPSGHSDIDKVTMALALFKQSHGHDFKDIHCWNLLKNEAKWIATQDRRQRGEQTNASDASPNDASDFQDVGDGSSLASVAPMRPIGRDAAKAAKKRNSATAASMDSLEYASKMESMHIAKMSCFKEDGDSQQRMHLETIE